MNYQWLTYQALLKAQHEGENPWTRLLKGRQESSSKSRQLQLSQIITLNQNSNEAQHTRSDAPLAFYQASSFHYEPDEFDEAVSRITGARYDNHQMYQREQQYGQDLYALEDEGREQLLLKKKKSFFSRIKKKIRKLVPSKSSKELEATIPTKIVLPDNQQSFQRQPTQKQTRPQSAMLQQRSTTPLQVVKRPSSSLSKRNSQQIQQIGDLSEIRYGRSSELPETQRDVFYEAQEMLEDSEANVHLIERERADILLHLTQVTVDQSTLNPKTEEEWERFNDLVDQRQELHGRLQELEDVSRQMDVCIGELKGMISRRDQMIQNFSYDEVRELQRVVVSSLLHEMDLKLKMFRQSSQQIARQQYQTEGRRIHGSRSGGLERELSVRLAPLEYEGRQFYDYDQNSLQPTPRPYGSQVSQDTYLPIQMYEPPQSQFTIANLRFSSAPQNQTPKALRTTTASFPTQFDSEDDSNQVHRNHKLKRDLSDSIIIAPQQTNLPQPSISTPFTLDWDSDEGGGQITPPNPSLQRTSKTHSQSSQSSRKELGLEISISQSIPVDSQENSPDLGKGRLWMPLNSYNTPQVFVQQDFDKQKGKKQQQAQNQSIETRKAGRYGGISQSNSYIDTQSMNAILEDSNNNVHNMGGTASTQRQSGNIEKQGRNGVNIELSQSRRQQADEFQASSSENATPVEYSPTKPPQPPSTPTPESKRSGTPPPPPPLMPKRGASPAPLPPPLGRGRGTGQQTVQKNRNVINMFQELRRSQLQQGPPRSPAAIPTQQRPVNKDALMAEIVGKSAYVEAVNRDIESQGEMINELINVIKIQKAKSMKDLTEFVREVDQRLLQLSDETAVLKAFDWPAARYDAFREACATYAELMKIKKQMESWKGLQKPSLNAQEELAKVQSYQEQIQIKMDKFSRTKDQDEQRFKEHDIPWPNNLNKEVVHSSLNLAAIYMEIVLTEASRLQESASKLSEEQKQLTRQKSLQLLTNAVRFGFRVHQFAGGFDNRCNQLFELICGQTRTNMPHNG